MTHNVWNKDFNSPAWEQKGEDCSAAARVGGLLRVYKETAPDIIGGQEFSARMADLMKEGFAEGDIQYTLIWGRFTPILYRADKFELVDSAFGTYPEEMPGFEGCFNDAKSKSWNLGVFRVKESGKLFIFATTHLWWKAEPTSPECTASNYQKHSDAAREYQIKMLIERIDTYCEQYGCPVILVGDLNTGYNSKAIQYALSVGYRHAHDIATDYAEESVGYHYCFPNGFKTEYYDKPFEWAIDHILLLGEKDGAVKRFERYSPDYYFPISDHSPAYIDIEL
jgi:exonuclease III